MKQSRTIDRRGRARSARLWRALLLLGVPCCLSGFTCAIDVAAAASPEGRAEADDAEPEEAERFTRLNWRSDLEAAVEEAKETGRLVMAYFRFDECQPCIWMEKGPFAARKMSIYLEQHFVPVRIDDTAGASPATRKYGVRIYPSVLVFDGQGVALHHVIGPRAAPELHAVLEQVRRLPDLFAAQKVKPEDLEANFALGNALAMLEQFSRAEPYLEKAAALDPENKHGRLSQAALMLAMVPASEGDARETLRNVNLFLERFPDVPEVPVALHLKGTVLFENGRLAEARQVFDDLRKRFPRHAMAYKADQAIRFIDTRLAEMRKQQEAQDGTVDGRSSASD